MDPPADVLNLAGGFTGSQGVRGFLAFHVVMPGWMFGGSAERMVPVREIK